MEDCLVNSLANVNPLCYQEWNMQTRLEPSNYSQSNTRRANTTNPTTYLRVNISVSITVQSCICHTPAYTAAGAGNLRVWGAGTNGNKTVRGTSARWLCIAINCSRTSTTISCTTCSWAQSRSSQQSCHCVCSTMWLTQHHQGSTWPSTKEQ